MLQLLPLLLLGTFQDDAAPLCVRARLAASALEPGAISALEVNFELAAGWSVAPNPLLPETEPRLFVQLAPPPGIELAGPSATTLPELLFARFLDLPFERVLPPGDSALEFRVQSAPSPGATFAFNALAYVRANDAPAARTRLVRLRFELALEPGAEAVQVPSTASHWGRGDALRLGERAPAFELPTASGTALTLATALDHPFLVLTVQRSCL